MQFTDLTKLVSRRDFAEAKDTFDTIEFISAHLRSRENLTKANRPKLLTIFRYIAGALGQANAQSVLEDCVKNGLPINEAFALGMHAYRYARDYDGAITGLKSLASNFRLTPYGAYLLGESCAASGRINDLFETAAQAQSLLRPLERGKRGPTAEWWSILALNMGLPNIADGFIPLIEDARMRETISQRRSSFTQSPIDLPAIMVNLDRDARKWNLASGAFQRTGYTDLSRYSAFDGTKLPFTVREQLVGGSAASRQMNAGAIGCWLSHLGVWEIVANSQKDWVLVLEDDAFPFVGASMIEQTFSVLDSSEFAWANLRMAGVHGRSSFDCTQHPISIWDQLKLWDSSRRGVGTDGYLLSPRGAQYLLNMFKAEKILGHVDGQMASHLLEATDAPVNKVQAEMAKRQQRYPFKDQLSATSLNIPLVCDIDFGASSTVQ